MVVQGALPGRGKDFRSPRDVSPDSGQAEVDAKLEQFAVDAGRAPERVDLGRRFFGLVAVTALRPSRFCNERGAQVMDARHPSEAGRFKEFISRWTKRRTDH